MTAPPPIGEPERRQRLAALRAAMDAAGIAATVLGSTESLRYFTGLVWGPSERLTGAVVTATGLAYLCPGFERSRVESLPILPGAIATWEEEEDPHALVGDLVGPVGRIALDEHLPLFAWHGFVRALGADRLADAAPLVRPLRARKSPAELALIGHAMRLTLGVHKEAHAQLRPGVRASEIAAFIDARHRALGADGGSTFCIVSFGAATALPHGADGDQVLEPGQLVLVDTGCRLDGYHSDLTRTYSLDTPDPDAARLWQIHHEAQAAAFAAARPGIPCEAVDAAARAVVEAHGLGPGYRLPGLPHRTGHGLGLDIHEPPNLVRGDRTPLARGMCFSCEPMLVMPGRFGIRLEDHFHMGGTGPVWFTSPQPSLTEPFSD
ncbi:MAG: Xaa-Pro peptidase family protein [Geminicoccaceae bacterium]